MKKIILSIFVALFCSRSVVAMNAENKHEECAKTCDISYKTLCLMRGSNHRHNLSEYNLVFCLKQCIIDYKNEMKKEGSNK